MVVHHWSDDGMVMYHRWSLVYFYDWCDTPRDCMSHMTSVTQYIFVYLKIFRYIDLIYVFGVSVYFCDWCDTPSDCMSRVTRVKQCRGVTPNWGLSGQSLNQAEHQVQIFHLLFAWDHHSLYQYVLNTQGCIFKGGKCWNHKASTMVPLESPLCDQLCIVVNAMIPDRMFKKEF